MIKARHAAWADRIFHCYVNRLYKKQFYAFYILDEPPSVDPDYPVMVLPNHSTWWDGFFIYFLNKCYFRRTVYLMMLEEQLARFSFFARLGAYSIDPRNYHGIRESIMYTRGILKNQPPPLVCIFPQGILSPWHKRPLDFQRGVDSILKDMEIPITLLPLAIKIEFLQQQRPEVFFQFGKPDILNPGIRLDVVALERAETTLLENMQHLIVQNRNRMIFKGTRSIHDVWQNYKQNWIKRA